MDVDSCIKYAKELVDFDINMLVVKIGEISKKHWDNKELTDKEKFIIGLRYSEFLATDYSDEAYYQAGVKRDACLRYLGVDFVWLMNQCKLICNLN